mmetsp:Transcript_9147/g.26714  ORF Transcript_9147/g.26714 Transcript_9147/m.26714 type:complete len:242 (-) Transcript_9147:947-1672(-)
MRMAVSFWLVCCTATISSVLPLASSASIGNPRLRLSSTRLMRPLRACEKTASSFGTPSPGAAWPARTSSALFSSRTTLSFDCSSSLRGMSLARAVTTLRMCSLCSMPSTSDMSVSRSSMRKLPSTEASSKARLYCESRSVSSQRLTSSTVQRRTSSGNGRFIASLTSSSILFAFSRSPCFLRRLAPIRSSAPSLRFLSDGIDAAAAAADAAAATDADEVTAARVVSWLISRICWSMFRLEK